MIALRSGLTLSNCDFSVVLSHPMPARVILAVPHDGLISNEFHGMFNSRSVGVKGRDAHVWPIANDIVHLCSSQGVRIDAVRFLVPREYVDANRELPEDPNLDPETRGETALDDPLLVPLYKKYHGALCRLVKRSVSMFGAGQILFVDLHGFGRQPRVAPSRGHDLILGTGNRSTICHGNVDRDFSCFMRDRGYSVFLPAEKPVVEGGDPFSAGHTTRWFAKQYGINALQIEIFSAFRKREGEVRGKRLAVDMAEFFSLLCV